MNKYISMTFFTLLVTLCPLIAKEISMENIKAPTMQLRAFPITKSFLYSMSETISNHRKFLVVVFSPKEDTAKIKKATSFLKKENIPFNVLTRKNDIDKGDKYTTIKKRSYLYIDAKSASQAFTAIKYMEKIDNMVVMVGKNLIPSDIINKAYGIFYSKLKKEDIFSDKVQDAYLIQQIQDLAMECLKNNHLLESVVESYMNDLFWRDGMNIIGLPKMDADMMNYEPSFVSEFGTTICNCNYDEVVPKAEYANTSFYKAFQHNHKRLFGEPYTLKKALKKVSIKPLKLTTNDELLHYFNSSFLSDAYSMKELKYTTNSKGVTIFCVRGNDGVRLCKTKKEILNQISLQNKTLY